MRRSLVQNHYSPMQPFLNPYVPVSPSTSRVNVTPVAISASSPPVTGQSSRRLRNEGSTNSEVEAITLSLIKSNAVTQSWDDLRSRFDQIFKDSEALSAPTEVKLIKKEAKEEAKKESKEKVKKKVNKTLTVVKEPVTYDNVLSYTTQPVFNMAYFLSQMLPSFISQIQAPTDIFPAASTGYNVATKLLAGADTEQKKFWTVLILNGVQTFKANLHEHMDIMECVIDNLIHADGFTYAESIYTLVNKIERKDDVLILLTAFKEEVEKKFFGNMRRKINEREWEAVLVIGLNLISEYQYVLNTLGASRHSSSLLKTRIFLSELFAYALQHDLTVVKKAFEYMARIYMPVSVSSTSSITAAISSPHIEPPAPSTTPGESKAPIIINSPARITAVPVVPSIFKGCASMPSSSLGVSASVSLGISAKKTHHHSSQNRGSSSSSSSSSSNRFQPV